MYERPVFTHDDRGIGVETLPSVSRISKDLPNLKREVIQPPVQSSPVPKAFGQLAGAGKLDLYPHKGPNYGRKITGELACYVTSANLMKACYGEFPSAENLILTNTQPSPQYKANIFLPKFIQDKMLPVGTVIWLKGNMAVDDPKSLKTEAKNHWIILAGFDVKPDGRRIPLFMDQGSMGSKSPRPIQQVYGNDRFVHRIFAPKKLYSPA